jgi:hypothetical protein
LVRRCGGAEDQKLAWFLTLIRLRDWIEVLVFKTPVLDCAGLMI